MSRNKEGLKLALKQLKIIQNDFWKNLRITGASDGLNTELEKAYRLADFIELGQLMCTDALEREESCGAHFREEFQTSDGEALRRDESYAYVSAYAYNEGSFELHKESLDFENIKPVVRSYK